MSKMDCNLIVYNTKKYYAQIGNPHKVLELLAAGKVIISTPIHHYINTHNLLIFCEDKISFDLKIKEVFSKINHYNTSSSIKNRKEYAFNSSYKKIIQNIETIINNTFKNQ